MKKITIILILMLSVSFGIQAQEVEHLDAKSFKEKVYNYTKNSTWKYEGDMPAIVDFYASWCPPCKMIAPFLKELAKEYEGKIKIYKIDVDKDKEVARTMKVRVMPTLFYITADGKIKKRLGGMPKAKIEHEINNYMKVKKN